MNGLKLQRPTDELIYSSVDNFIYELIGNSIYVGIGNMGNAIEDELKT